MSNYLDSLDNNSLLERLIKEYLIHGRLLVGFDFDDTVCLYDKVCPEPTALRPELKPVCELIRELRPYALLTLWTARSESHTHPYDEYDTLTEAKNWLKAHNIPYDNVNDDGPAGIGSRKVYFNILLDDRAGLPSAYETLQKFLKWVKGVQDGVRI